MKARKFPLMCLFYEISRSTMFHLLRIDLYKLVNGNMCLVLRYSVSRLVMTLLIQSQGKINNSRLIRNCSSYTKQTFLCYSNIRITQAMLLELSAFTYIYMSNIPCVIQLIVSNIFKIQLINFRQGCFIIQTKCNIKFYLL